MWEIVRFYGKNVGSLEDFNYEIQRGSHVIQAINEFDEGQDSNGGGKSTFIDIPVIALLDSSLSKKSPKDLVNWDDNVKSMDLGAELLNNATKEIMSIRRVYYKGTKSAELYLSIDGVTPKHLPTKRTLEGAVDTKAGNEFILETIGISKEKLLDYFLVSEANHTSFFTLSGTKKQEIFEQFASVDLVDTQIESLELSASVLAEKLKNLATKRETAKTDIEALSDKLAEMKKSEAYDEWQLEKDQEIESINADIKKNDQEIELTTTTIDQGEIEISGLEKRNASSEEFLIQLNEAVARAEKNRDEVKSETNPYQEERDSKKEQLTELQEFETNALSNISFSEGNIGKLEAQLSHAIVCPNCDHEFILQSSIEDIREELEEAKREKESIQKDYQELKDFMDVVKTELTTLSAKYQRWDAQITDRLKLANKKVDEAEQARNKTKQLISELTNQVERIRSRNKSRHQQIEDLNKANDRLREDIKRVSLREFDGDAEIKVTQNLIKEKKKIVSAITAEFVEVEEKESWYNKWINNLKDFKFFVINKRVKTISGLINHYLQKNGSDLSVRIDGVKETRSKTKQEFTPMILRNGTNPQFYQQFSGGERARLNVAADMAFQTLINQSAGEGKGLNYYQSDEVLNPVDKTGIASVAKSLNSLDKPVFLVTHSGTDLIYDKKVVIVKGDDEVSRIMK